MMFAILEAQKIPVNFNLRMIERKFGKRNHQRTATKADSEAILPNRTQLFFLRAAEKRPFFQSNDNSEKLCA